MNCYDCHPDVTPAVATCKLCGKGVCWDHCWQQERPVCEHVPADTVAQVRDTGRRGPQRLSRDFAAAVGAGDREAAGDVQR